MGRHTRHVEKAAPSLADGEDRSRWVRRLGKVPLLPTVAGVVALGAIITAVGSQQISLNFAGGAPSAQPSRATQQPVSPSQGPRHTSQDGISATVPGDHAARRGGDRASRGSSRSSVTVAFRMTSRWATGFRATATITNRGDRTLQDWTLTVRYPRTKILSAKDVTVVRRGPVLVVRPQGRNPSLGPGQTYRVAFTASGSGTAPSSCAFNGHACGR